MPTSKGSGWNRSVRGTKSSSRSLQIGTAGRPALRQCSRAPATESTEPVAATAEAGRTRRGRTPVRAGKTPELSVVIPVFDEEGSLPPLHRALTESLRGIAYELVYVDDGSTDGSRGLLEQLASQDTKHTRVVVLRRNFGQTAAIAAGIDHSQGEIITLIDADLQNDPADIPTMLEKIEAGYDVVSGWRVNRQDTFLTRI